MVSRFMELERKTLLVQFIAVDPLAFYATSDGTDLVQNILRSHLARPDSSIFGQEGSLSISDNGEFLTFEPVDTKNRALHLPIEHLAYCGALRRLLRDPKDPRNPDQILKRDFENVDLANRYAHYITGPPIFVAVFHGFDNALCYTFVTQSADDACLSVTKLMRAFRRIEQQQFEHEQEQGHENQGQPPIILENCERPPSPVIIHQTGPLDQLSQPLCVNNRQILSSPAPCQTHNILMDTCLQTSYQDELVQRLLSNSNLQIINQPYPSSPSVACHSINPPTTFVIQQNSLMFSTGGCCGNPLSGPTSFLARTPSAPMFASPSAGLIQSLSMGNACPPQVIYKPNNEQLTYKQNIMVRWLKAPTPPPPAPIIIREIHSPPEVPPPIICRQYAPCPPTPPPLVVREPPPPCPPPTQPLVIEKHLPRTCLPRQVIVQRYPPPPPKPQPIIYEKYLPQPQPPPRQVIVQRETCQPSGALQQQRQIVVQNNGCSSTVCSRIPQQQQQCVTCQSTVCSTVPQQQCSIVPTTVCSTGPQSLSCRRVVSQVPGQSTLVCSAQQCAPAQSTLVCRTQQCAPAQPAMVCTTQQCAPVQPAMVCTTQQCAPAQPAMVCTTQQCAPVQPAMVCSTQQCAPAQQTLVCNTQQQQHVVPGQSQVVQQITPVYAQRQHIVQPKGVRVIRQVIGPAHPSTLGQAYAQQPHTQFCAPIGRPF